MSQQAQPRARQDNLQRRFDGQRLQEAASSFAAVRVSDPELRERLVSELTHQLMLRSRKCPSDTPDPTAWLVQRIPLAIKDAWRVIDTCPRDGRAALHALAQAEHSPGEASRIERALLLLRAKGWSTTRIEWARGFLKASPALETQPFDEALPVGPLGASAPEAFAQAKLQQFVRRLRPDDRELFTLKAEGHSQQDIAGRLGVCAATVSLRVQALKARFIREVL